MQQGLYSQNKQIEYTTAASNRQENLKGAAQIAAQMMTTPDKLRTDAAKLDAYLEAFECAYLHFLDIGNGERKQRDQGMFAFFEIRDKVDSLIAEMDELAGHIEVCDAIFATGCIKRGGAV